MNIICLLLSACILFTIHHASAQGNSCPGCVADAMICPNFTGREVIQVCLDTLPHAASNAPYDLDITFRITDQLAYRANDTVPGTGFTFGFLQQFGFPITLPITVRIDSARLIDVYGLPSGLSWTCDSAANGCFYSLPTSGTACFKICGNTQCYLRDTTFTIAIEVEYTQDLTNLINIFSGGGGFPFPLPIPSTQTNQEIFYYNLTIKGSGAPLLQITSTAPNDTITEGESATLSANNGFNSYLWSNNLTTASITVSPVQTTTYSVIATDADGCTQTATYTLNVTRPQEPIDTNSGIANRHRNDLFSIYPNPAREHLIIEIKQKNDNEAFLQILNLQGKVIFTEQLLNQNNLKKQVSLTAFSKGLYIVMLKTADGIQTEKLLIH